MLEHIKKVNSNQKIFKSLNPLISKWFEKRFGKLTEAQKCAILPIQQRQNILVSSPTGSGKTLCAFTSILSHLIDLSEGQILEDRIYCVYVSPLKALTRDVEVNLKGPLREIEEIAGKKLGIRIAVRTGDTPTSEKQKMLRKPPHILVCTPETLAIVISSPKFRENFRGLQWMVIDEIHALAQNKRGVHLSLTVERLAQLSGGITRVGLSATIAPLEDVAKFLVGSEKGKERNCKIVDVRFIKNMDLKVISPVKDLINTSQEELHKSLYGMLDNLIQEHKTTLIFTNTRAATERVVDHLKNKFPKKYTENIGAHHGSLSKEHRLGIENRLRDGKLKCVVTSTSLELGIDIGYIDLVVLLGSPKSVARCLQRIGRSGHKLHETAKGRIVVLDRDDLVECSVMLKEGIERKIDRVHIPNNCLDVLAQHIYGIAIDMRTNVKEIYSLIKGSYCYRDLKYKDYMDVIEYLAGRYVSLEDRHIYAKIWYDEETGEIGKRGKLARVLYMTNIGTIPDESAVHVKIGNRKIGTIEEPFLEKMKRGDIFVLGGQTYMFKFARGMVAQVSAASARPPTVPSWFSEMLPLSFDLANEIGRFRRLMEEKLKKKEKKKEVVKWIHKFLYVDDNAANAIYEYFREQFLIAEIGHDKKLVIEHYTDDEKKYVIFHSLYGRRVNDVLARVVAYAIGRLEHKDVEIGINDNGFYVASKGKFSVMKAFELLKSNELKAVVEKAIDRTEVLKRRFRHCATRALMILRNYKGRKKRVGRQQVSSMILMNTVRQLDEDFSILKEARREVLEDLMDLDNAIKVLKEIEDGKIKVKEIFGDIPSVFAFNLVLQGHYDILKMDDKLEFLRRMHNLVQAKIGLKHGKED